MSDLNQLLQVFQKNKVDFVLVGGFAAVLHGSSQVTQDIDLCLPLTPKLIGQLRKILEPYHPIIRGHPKRLSFLKHPESLENVKNLYLQTDLGPVDLISQVKGIGSFQDALAHSIAIRLFNDDCRVLNIKALIEAKKAMGRSKDLAVIEELTSLLPKNC